MIAFYDNQPTKLEAVGNGSYVYRFNIQKVEKPATVEPSELASDDEAPPPASSPAGWLRRRIPCPPK